MQCKYIRIKFSSAAAKLQPQKFTLYARNDVIKVVDNTFCRTMIRHSPQNDERAFNIETLKCNGNRKRLWTNEDDSQIDMGMQITIVNCVIIEKQQIHGEHALVFHESNTYICSTHSSVQVMSDDDGSKQSIYYVCLASSIHWFIRLSFCGDAEFRLVTQLVRRCAIAQSSQICIETHRTAKSEEITRPWSVIFAHYFQLTGCCRRWCFMYIRYSIDDAISIYCVGPVKDQSHRNIINHWPHSPSFIKSIRIERTRHGHAG